MNNVRFVLIAHHIRHTSHFGEKTNEKMNEDHTTISCGQVYNPESRMRYCKWYQRGPLLVRCDSRMNQAEVDGHVTPDADKDGGVIARCKCRASRQS